jgi:methylphosphotriester-DNA--protein-cysteine methyltransferase
MSSSPAASPSRSRAATSAGGAFGTATPARDVGYTSEFAFNRAFARHRRQPPGRYRRAARAAMAG